jgi:hypothetical protein
MKSKLSAALTAFAIIALFLPSAARAAEIVVTLTETSVNGGPDTLSVTGLAGASISGTTSNGSLLVRSVRPDVAWQSQPLSWLSDLRQD